MVELRIPDSFGDQDPDLVPPSEPTSTRVSKISTGGVFGDASFFLSSTYTCRYTRREYYEQGVWHGCIWYICVMFVIIWSIMYSVAFAVLIEKVYL